MRASRKMWHENRSAQSLTDGIVDVKEGATPARVGPQPPLRHVLAEAKLVLGIWPVTSSVPPEGTPGTQQNCLRGTISGKTDGQGPRQAWKVLRRYIYQQAIRRLR